MEVLTYRDLCKHVNNQVAKIHRVQHLVTQGKRFDFERFYNSLTDCKKIYVMALVSYCDEVALENLILKQRSTGIQDVGVLDLKRLASKMKIRNYSRMTRGELVATIIKIQEEAKKGTHV